MKARVVIAQDGQVAFFTEEGDFEGGKLAIEKMVKLLKASGVDFAEVGAVEQHRHDGQEVHSHVHS